MPPKKKTTKNSSFADAIGYGQSPFGFPEGPARQPVSSTTTLYENLRYYLISNDRNTLSYLYSELGLVQAVVNVPVDDALRGGIMFKSKEINESEQKELQITMDREGDVSTAGWAAKWTRLYGGGGIMLLTDQDPMEPFDVNQLKKGDKVDFRALDLWELFWDKQNIEGVTLGLTDHEVEWYSYYGVHVHKTRVMRMKGIEAPSFVRPRLRGWGLSVVEAFIRSLNQYLKAIDLTFEVLDEFKVDVYKVKNLVNTLLSPNGQNLVKQRIQMANWQKNYQNALVMDSEDDWDHKQVSFAGLGEAMAGIRMQVASDLRMPITKLFGTSVSAGFATDQNDMENYNSMVEAEVRQKLKYDLLRMAGIRCQTLFGYVPEDLEIEFKPLRELSATDQEIVKTSKFTRLLQAQQAALITAQEFRENCNKGNLFDASLDTVDDGLDDGLSPQDDAYSESKENPDEDTDANKPDSRKTEAV